jgi:hypothetical protein
VPSRPDSSASAASDEEEPLAERVTALHGLLEIILCTASGPHGQAGSLDSHERAVLDRALFRTYARAGITTDAATHDRPAPLLRDLAATLSEMPGEAADSLAARLDCYVEGSLSAGLFAGPTNVSLDRAFVVFQIRDLAEELRPLLAGGKEPGLVRQPGKMRHLELTGMDDSHAENSESGAE